MENNPFFGFCVFLTLKNPLIGGYKSIFGFFQKNAPFVLGIKIRRASNSLHLWTEAQYVCFISSQTGMSLQTSIIRTFNIIFLISSFIFPHLFSKKLITRLLLAIDFFLILQLLILIIIIVYCHLHVMLILLLSGFSIFMFPCCTNQ